MPSTEHKSINRHSGVDVRPAHPLLQKMLAAAAAYERLAQQQGKSGTTAPAVLPKRSAGGEDSHRRRPQAPTKLTAAREAYRRRCTGQAQSHPSQGRRKSAKQLAAGAVLVRRYREQREHLRETKGYAPLTCEAKVDRVVLTVSTVNKNLLDALRTIPGYGMPKGQKLWGQAYGWVERLSGAGSIRRLTLEYDRQASWLSPLRVTIVPRDATGLLYEDLRSILELLPDFQINLVEIALDFDINSVVDMTYVRKHCLFGKLRPRSVGRNPIWDLWGTR